MDFTNHFLPDTRTRLTKAFPPRSQSPFGIPYNSRLYKPAHTWSNTFCSVINNELAPASRRPAMSILGGLNQTPFILETFLKEIGRLNFFLIPTIK